MAQVHGQKQELHNINKEGNMDYHNFKIEGLEYPIEQNGVFTKQNGKTISIVIGLGCSFNELSNNMVVEELHVFKTHMNFIGSDRIVQILRVIPKGDIFFNPKGIEKPINSNVIELIEAVNVVAPDYSSVKYIKMSDYDIKEWLAKDHKIAAAVNELTVYVNRGVVTEEVIFGLSERLGLLPTTHEGTIDIHEEGGTRTIDCSITIGGKNIINTFYIKEAEMAENDEVINLVTITRDMAKTNIEAYYTHQIDKKLSAEGIIADQQFALMTNEDDEAPITEYYISKDKTSANMEISSYFLILCHKYGIEYVRDNYKLAIILTPSILEDYKYKIVFSSGKGVNGGSIKYSVALVPKITESMDEYKYQEVLTELLDDNAYAHYRANGYNFMCLVSEEVATLYRDMVISGICDTQDFGVEYIKGVYLSVLQLNRKASKYSETLRDTTFINVSAANISDEKVLELAANTGQDVSLPVEELRVILTSNEGDGSGFMVTSNGRDSESVVPNPDKLGGYVTYGTSTFVIKGVCSYTNIKDENGFSLAVMKVEFWLQRSMTDDELDKLNNNYLLGIDTVFANMNIIKDVNVHTVESKSHKDIVEFAWSSAENFATMFCSKVNVPGGIRYGLDPKSGVMNNFSAEDNRNNVYMDDGVTISGAYVQGITAISVGRGPNDIRAWLAQSEYDKNPTFWSGLIEATRTPSMGGVSSPVIVVVADILALAPFVVTPAFMRVINGDEDGDGAILREVCVSLRSHFAPSTELKESSVDENYREQSGNRYIYAPDANGCIKSISLATSIRTMQFMMEDGLYNDELTMEIYSKYFDANGNPLDKINKESLVKNSMLINELAEAIAEKKVLLNAAKELVSNLETELVYVQLKAELSTLYMRKSFVEKSTTIRKNTLACTKEEWILNRFHRIDPTTGQPRSGLFRYNTTVEISEIEQFIPESTENSVEVFVETVGNIYVIPGGDEKFEPVEYTKLRLDVEAATSIEEKVVICHAYAGNVLVPIFANGDFNYGQVLANMYGRDGIMLLMDRQVQETAIQMQKKIKDLAPCINRINFVIRAKSMLTSLDLTPWVKYTNDATLNAEVLEVSQANLKTRFITENPDKFLNEMFRVLELIKDGDTVIENGIKEVKVNKATIGRRLDRIAKIASLMFSYNVEMDENDNPIDGVAPGFHGKMVSLFTNLYMVNNKTELDNLLLLVGTEERKSMVEHLCTLLNFRYLSGGSGSSYGTAEFYDTFISEKDRVIEYICWVIGQPQYAQIVAELGNHKNSGAIMGELNISANKAKNWKHSFHRLPIVQSFANSINVVVNALEGARYEQIIVSEEIYTDEEKATAYKVDKAGEIRRTEDGRAIPKMAKPKNNLKFSMPNGAIEFNQLLGVTSVKVTKTVERTDKFGNLYMKTYNRNVTQFINEDLIGSYLEVIQMNDDFRFNLCMNVTYRLWFGNDSDYVSDEAVIDCFSGRKVRDYRETLDYQEAIEDSMMG